MSTLVLVRASSEIKVGKLWYEPSVLTTTSTKRFDNCPTPQHTSWTICDAMEPP